MRCPAQYDLPSGPEPNRGTLAFRRERVSTPGRQGYAAFRTPDGHINAKVGPVGNVGEITNHLDSPWSIRVPPRIPSR